MSSPAPSELVSPFFFFFNIFQCSCCLQLLISRKNKPDFRHSPQISRCLYVHRLHFLSGRMFTPNKNVASSFSSERECNAVKMVEIKRSDQQLWTLCSFFCLSPSLLTRLAVYFKEMRTERNSSYSCWNPSQIFILGGVTIHFDDSIRIIICGWLYNS